MNTNDKSLVRIFQKEQAEKQSKCKTIKEGSAQVRVATHLGFVIDSYNGQWMSEQEVVELKDALEEALFQWKIKSRWHLEK